MYRRLKSDEKGLSLIEVVLAITILSIVILALGALMFQIARHARASAGVAYRAAASESAASWVHGLPFDSVSLASGCTSNLTTGLLEYTRCVVVSPDGPRYKVARITITATGDLRPSPDTITVERINTRSPSPFGFE